MGLFNFLKTGKRALDAQMDKAAESIEQENAVEFGKQEIEQMKTELRKIRGNIGTVKGEMAVIEENRDNVKAQIKKHEDDAKALMESGNEELALANADEAEKLDPQLQALEASLETQRKMLDKQLAAKRKFENALRQAESDQVTLKTMTDAAKANEKLSAISSDTGENALAKYKNRLEDAKKRLIKSEAISDDSNEESDLSKQTAEALGKTGAKARLAKLMEKKESE